MKSFYFLCITQPTNLGDLVINKMLVDELCLYGKVYVDAYNTPERFRNVLTDNNSAIDLFKENGFSAKRFNLLRLYLLAKREKIHFFVSSPGPIEGGNTLYSIAVSIIRYVFKLAGAKNYCIGGCCSSMISSHKIIRKGIVDHYFMRSYASVNYINSKKNGLASYIPDLAYLLRMYITPSLSYRVKSSSKNRVLINFREFNDTTGRFFLWCQDIINAFSVAGHKVILYYQVESDFAFMNKLYQSTKSDSVEFREDIVWYGDLAIYEDAMCVISNRLHSILIGAGYGAIPLACVSEHKLTSKIQDVLESSLGEIGLSLSVPYFTSVDKIIAKVVGVDGLVLESKINDSAKLCREVIKNLVFNGD